MDLSVQEPGRLIRNLERRERYSSSMSPSVSFSLSKMGFRYSTLVLGLMPFGMAMCSS